MVNAKIPYVERWEAQLIPIRDEWRAIAERFADLDVKDGPRLMAEGPVMDRAVDSLNNALSAINELREIPDFVL